MQMTQQPPKQPCNLEWFLFNEGGDPVSTFIPFVVSLIKVIGSNGEREDVRLKLSFKDGSDTEAIVPLLGLDRVAWFEKDHRCIVNSKCRQEKQRYIANIIQDRISNAPVEVRYALDRTGIHHIDDAIVFAAGGSGYHPVPRDGSQS